MEHRYRFPPLRLVAIALVLFNAALWLHQQHLAPAEHEHALLGLVALGYLAAWLTQERRK